MSDECKNIPEITDDKGGHSIHVERQDGKYIATQRRQSLEAEKEDDMQDCGTGDIAPEDGREETMYPEVRKVSDEVGIGAVGWLVRKYWDAYLDRCSLLAETGEEPDDELEWLKRQLDYLESELARREAQESERLDDLL